MVGAVSSCASIPLFRFRVISSFPFSDSLRLVSLRFFVQVTHVTIAVRYTLFGHFFSELRGFLTQNRQIYIYMTGRPGGVSGDPRAWYRSVS